MNTSELEALLGRGGEGQPAKVPTARRADLEARLGRKLPLHRDLAWPGGTLPIRVRVLTAAERQRAIAAARETAPAGAAPGAAPADQARFQVEQVLHILVRAVLVGGGAEPLCSSVDELDALCTEDELNALYQLYADVRRSADPAGVSEETITELAAAATAGDRAAFLEAAETLPRAALFTLLERIVTTLAAAPLSASPAPEEAG